MMILKELKFEDIIYQKEQFSALATRFRLIFYSNLFIAFEVKFLTNPGILSLAKGKQCSLVLSLLNYLTKIQKTYLIELF